MAEKHFEISRRHFQSRCDCASLSNVFPPWFFTKYSVGFKSTVTELIKPDRNQEKRVKEEVKGGKKEITGLETSFSLTLGPPVCLQGPVIPLCIFADHPSPRATFSKLCSCFGSCLCYKYRTEIRHV